MVLSGTYYWGHFHCDFNSYWGIHLSLLSMQNRGGCCYAPPPPPEHISILNHSKLHSCISCIKCRTILKFCSEHGSITDNRQHNRNYNHIARLYRETFPMFGNHEIMGVLCNIGYPSETQLKLKTHEISFGITWVSLLQSLWNFAQSTEIGLLHQMLWTNEI